jgi:carbon storage regulator
LEYATVLVLSRRVGEQIVVDGRIVITIVAIAGGVVRVGIDAPPDVAINRGEIERALRAEGRHDVRDGRRGDAPMRQRAA